MRPWKPVALCALISLLAPVAAAAQAPPTPIAVFNFRLTTATPRWVWLEKYLSDQITTDFAGTPSLAVIARDRMQLLAGELHWVPEMAEDAGRMAVIRAKTRIQYLVSGLASVKEEQVELIGQIIEVASRKELFRKTLTGPTKEVLNLQKQLSAELLGWFTKKPAAELLPTLPVWTKSIPAVEALYQGMDLYDRGHYADAWLKFRSSSRKDPDYVEALYWVGKMYYFMNRYEHARRSMERFVYTNAAHPRIGDAIKEYLDTYETLEDNPETLLRLYEHFGARWPAVKIVEPSVYLGTTPCGEWTRLRAGRAHLELGQYEEGTRAAKPAFARGMPHSTIATDNLMLLNALTGRTPPVDALADEWYHRNFLLFFSDARPEATAKPPVSAITVMKTPEGRLTDSSTMTVVLLAPSGQRFTRLRFFPALATGELVFTVRIHQADRPFHDFCAVSAPVSKAATDGLAAEEFPRTGLLLATLETQLANAKVGQRAELAAYRIQAELKDIGPFGAVEVACPQTSDFRVMVDGRPGRFFKGVIGLLRPGRHSLRFIPLDEDGALEPWETTVEVQEGKIARVIGQLGWKKVGPLAGWDPIQSVGRTYPGRRVSLGRVREPPQLLADDREIRLLWSHQLDLWTSASADGRNFSPPRKLELPLSSAWAENGVRCLPDESGRYVMLFRSDRDAQHRDLCYVTWSRDFVHWSAPRLVGGASRPNCRLIRDQRGRYLLLDWDNDVSPAEKGEQRDTQTWFSLLISTDALSWKRAACSLRLPEPVSYPDVLFRQLPDGRFSVIAACATSGASNRSSWFSKDLVQLFQAESDDLKTWTVREETLQCPSASRCLVMVNGGRLEVLVLLSRATYNTSTPGVRLLWQDSAGRWMLSEPAPGIGADTAACHPGWGYLIAFMGSRGHDFSPQEPDGPYFLRGASLEDFKRTGLPAIHLTKDDYLRRMARVVPPVLADEPEDHAPVPNAGQTIGFDSVKDLLSAVDEAVQAGGGQVQWRRRLPCVEPGGRHAEAERIVALRDKLVRHLAVTRALLTEKLGQGTVMFLDSHFSRLGLSAREQSPLARAYRDGRIDWNLVRIDQIGNTAKFVVDGRGTAEWPIVRVQGKWYLGWQNDWGGDWRKFTPERAAFVIKDLDDLAADLRQGRLTLEAIPKRIAAFHGNRDRWPPLTQPDADGL